MCQQFSNPDGKAIGVLFEENKPALTRVFAKYGVDAAHVTFDNMVGLAGMHEGFAYDAATEMVAPYSNATGDEDKQKQITLAATILGALGGVTSVAANVLDQFKTPTVTEQKPDATTTTTTDPDKDNGGGDKKAGLTTGQIVIGISLFAALMLLVFIVASSGDKK